MLLGLLLAAVLASVLISRRLCAGASAARVYGSLLGALLVSAGITAGWSLHRFVTSPQITVWRIVNIVFYGACWTLPLIFLAAYWILVRFRRRNAGRSGPFAALVSSATLSIMFGLLVVGMYASWIEPNRIEVTQTSLRTKYLAPGSTPLKIVQLSDLHIDRLGYREKKALKLVAGLKPDFIFLTGDYTNHLESNPDVRRFLEGLEARYGVYAVHGNWNQLPEARWVFRDLPITLLHYGAVVVRTKSGRVVVGGVPWYGAEEAGVCFRKVSTRNSYVILLCHTPDAGLYSPSWVDLVLAGHTHGGQVRLPFIGPIVNFTDVSRDQSVGLTKLPQGSRLYVNRGLGMEGGGAPRIRLLCRPEISLFTISPESRNHRGGDG